MAETAPQLVQESRHDTDAFGPILTPITIEEFFDTHEDTIREMLDGLDVDYRSDAEAAFVTEFYGCNTFGLELESTDAAAGTFDKEIMLIDETREAIPVGYGFITFFRDGPARVGDTFTREGYRRHGLGRRRLELMDAIVRKKTGQVLHSGTSIEPEAESLWRALAAEGRAETYQTPSGLERWRFIE